MRLLGCLLLAFGIGLGAAPATATNAATSVATTAPAVDPAREGEPMLAATKKKAPPKKKRRTPPPDRRKEPPPQRVDPLMVSAAAAGGAAGGACVGASTVVTAAVIGIGVAVATPFMAALGGGAAVLLADPRSKPEEWSSLLQCAASGYCMGLSLIGGTLLGATGCGLPVCGMGQTPDKIPGPDRAAEWTAGSAIAGLVGGTIVGGLLGWAMAPDPNDPFIPIAIGAGSGGVLGAGVLAGAGAAIATAVRR